MNVNNVVVMKFVDVDVVADNIMNQQDRKEFEIVHLKMDDMRQEIFLNLLSERNSIASS